uniref:Uncharacterized protein n=1 Tax=Setaria digitata TaxID=48799 RepID=A0A915Q3Q5_9BILA
MSESNLQSISSTRKSEAETLQDYLENQPDAYSSSTSSFEENFNCDEMFVITIDDPIVANTSALSDSDEINSDRNQFATKIPARSISCVMDEEVRQKIRAVCFPFLFLLSCS